MSTPIVVPSSPSLAPVEAVLGGETFRLHLTHAAARAALDQGVDVYAEAARMGDLVARQAAGEAPDVPAVVEAMARILFAAALPHQPLATVQTFLDVFGFMPGEATIEAAGQVIERLFTPAPPQEAEDAPAGKPKASRSRTSKG